MAIVQNNCSYVITQPRGEVINQCKALPLTQMLDEHYLTASSEESSSNAPTSYQPLFHRFISHKPYFWPLRPLAAAVTSLLLYPKPSRVEEPGAALHWVHNASLCCWDIALQLVAHLPPCFQGTQHICATPLPLADLKQ